MNSATQDWNLLHDRFYRKLLVYPLAWSIKHIEQYLIAVAPYAGPIALIRNDKKIFALQNQPTKPTLYIYSAAGTLLTQIQWDKGRIIGFGWTISEKLMIVLEYGSVRVYDIHGEYLQFSLGQDAKDYGVLDCKFWDSGLVAFTGNFKLIAITDIDDPKPKSLADPGLTKIPNCWAIIPPKFTLSEHLEVLLSVNSTILVVDATENIQDQELQLGPFTKISVSPDGKFLALLTKDRLLVVSSDFEKNLAEFATNSTSPCLQMTWCGTDSVVLNWEDTLLMVGPFGDWIKYSYEGIVHMMPEIDGVRIISTDKSEFLQRVPTSTEDIFKFGSTTPGAVLYDAFEYFEKKSPKADENIRSITDTLSEAVDACIDAAAHESTSTRQKSLLRAASFGKCFLDFYDGNKFVDMCHTIRILNSIRDRDIGIPLTYAQYQQLTPQVVIDRLVNRHHHLLALKICNFLKLNNSRVLIHWACAKIKNSAGDEDVLCTTIVDKLGGKSSGISYAQIAKAAYVSGQTRLATKLLDYEPQAASQVPLLLSMQADEVALVKAIESGDTDLVYLVILHIKRKLPPADFFRIISKKKLSTSLFESYARQCDVGLLVDFYYQEDRKADNANILLLEGLFALDGSEKVDKLKKAMKLYNDDKEYSFEAKAVDEQIKLISLQSQLERDTGHSFASMSVSETISKCLQLGHGNRAAKIKSEYKVPDKRFWWLKVKAFVQTHNWDALESFSKSTPKFPISGIIDVLLKAGQVNQANKFLEIMVKNGGNDAVTNQYIELLRNFTRV